MGLTELLILAVGLSMDAFAASLADGLCCKQLSRRWIGAIGICFGGMQGLMPLLGYWLGMCFLGIIEAFDHYIALILLSVIGIHMLIEALHADAEHQDAQMTGKLLMLQGIATSIDALAVGVSFAALGSFSVYLAVGIIAAVTACISMFGAWLGTRVRAGEKLGSRAQILGGILLIGIGIKIFVSHMWM